MYLWYGSIAGGSTYDAPGFHLGLINANDQVNQVKHIDFGQTLVNLDHHLKNLANKH
jgi:hypothetical protein